MNDIALLNLKDIKCFYQPCILKLMYANYDYLKNDKIENIFVLGYVRLTKDNYIETKILHKDIENNHLYEYIRIEPYEYNSFIYDVKWVNQEISQLFEDEYVMEFEKFRWIKKDNLKITDIIKDNWYKVF